MKVIFQIMVLFFNIENILRSKVIYSGLNPKDASERCPVMYSFINDFAMLFIVVAAISFSVKLIKQPIIIGYIISGFIFSFLIGADAAGSQIMSMAELGITFLLFLMGLEFSLSSLKYLGKDIFIATSLQTIALFFVAFVPAKLLGFSANESIYLAILFMFSSTLLVAKWVEDKKETSSLHGKMILGILVVQDIFAILILSILNLFGETGIEGIILVPLKGLILIAVAFIFARYILNRLFRFALKYPELMFVLSLGICFLFVEISPLLGYSTSIGAFIAGITLANTEYKNEILSRLKPLIIFFNLLFFVGMGFQLDTDFAPNAVSLIVMFLVLCFIAKPVAVYLTLKLRGYDLRTAFKAALSLSQFSEFGMIIIFAGISAGLVSAEISPIAILLIVATMAISSYLIKYESILFKYCENSLKKIDVLFKNKKKEEESGNLKGYQILFFGYYDLGKEFFLRLEGRGKKTLVIENDPQNIRLLKNEKIPFVYSSIYNPYFLDRIDFTNVEIAVSSLVNAEDNKLIIKTIKRNNPKTIIIATAKSVSNSLELYDTGADYVIYPSYLNEQNVSVLLEDYTSDINRIISKKIEDVAKLKEKEERIKSANLVFDVNEFLKKL